MSKELHVLIGIPAYSNTMLLGTFRSLLFDCLYLMNAGVKIEIIDGISGAEIDTIRNKMVSRLAAHPEATHLIMVDSDVCWDSGDLIRLLAANIDSDRDVVAGIYPKRSTPIEFPFEPKLSDDGCVLIDPDTGLVECKHVPAGFLCIPKGTAKHLCEEYNNLKYKAFFGNNEQDDYEVWSLFEKLWRYDEASGEQVRASEDVSFCRRVIEAGGTVWAHPDILMGHVGYRLYKAGICGDDDPRYHNKKFTPGGDH